MVPLEQMLEEQEDSEELQFYFISFKKHHFSPNLIYINTLSCEIITNHSKSDCYRLLVCTVHRCSCAVVHNIKERKAAGMESKFCLVAYTNIQICCL